MAVYQGKNVELNSPRRIRKGEPGYGRKSKVVYVKDKDSVKRVTYGDPKMKVKKQNAARKRSFDARMKCDEAGPKTKARYWACKDWKN